MGNWISVKDRLPEVFHHENGEPFQFIVFIEGASVSTVLCFDGENWRDYDLVSMKYCSDFYRVTHWQPLPEPPDSKGFYVKSVVSKNKDLEFGSEDYKFVDFVVGGGEGMNGYVKCKNYNDINYFCNVKHCLCSKILATDCPMLEKFFSDEPREVDKEFSSEMSLVDRVADLRKTLNDNANKAYADDYGVRIEDLDVYSGSSDADLVLFKLRSASLERTRASIEEAVFQYEKDELRKEQLAQVSMQTELLRRLLDRSEVDE